MKAVHCSWVEMQRLRSALSADRRGDQAALTKMLACVDKSTVNAWKATADLMSAVEGKVDLSQLSEFQPTHGRELARYMRRTRGKDKKKWDGDEVAGWIGLVEEQELTVEQFKAVLKETQIAPPSDTDPCCKTDDLQKLIDAGIRFGCIYADPPWQYGNQGTRAATDNHYGTMTLEAIASLPVGKLAAPRSHLHLWTTDSFLEPAIELLTGWGFERRQTFVWVKPQLGIGNYWRSSHEYMLLGIRGGLTFPPSNVKSWGQWDRTEHSEKPEGVRSLIEQMSPGPRLEMFARKTAPGWTSWGNQIRQSMFGPAAVEVGLGTERPAVDTASLFSEESA